MAELGPCHFIFSFVLFRGHEIVYPVHEIKQMKTNLGRNPVTVYIS